MHLKYLNVLIVMLFAATNSNMYADHHHRHDKPKIVIIQENDTHNENGGYAEAGRVFLVGGLTTFGCGLAAPEGKTLQYTAAGGVGSLFINAGISVHKINNNTNTAKINIPLQLVAAIAGPVAGMLLVYAIKG